MELVFIKTPIGIAKIEGNEIGITVVQIIDEIKPISSFIPELLIDAVQQLTEYFEGKRNTFSIKLNPKGTDFQKRVWKSLVEIPYGKTYSYMQLSKKIGNPKSIRAVAAANAKNPLWIVVPCHRIIGSDGSLTGYAGGLQRKKWLLAHENAIKQQSLF